MFSKCANPECFADFDYRHGRFFRFRQNQPEGDATLGSHSVRHLWLCERCSEAQVLEYREGIGVLMRERLQVDPIAQIPRLIATA